MRQSSMRTWASRRLSNCQPLSSSSRSRPLNDSIQAFCHGEPGSMNHGGDAVEAAPVSNSVGDELGTIVVVNRSQAVASASVGVHADAGTSGALERLATPFWVRS